MFAFMRLIRSFFTKNFWTNKWNYVAFPPLILSLASFICFFVLMAKAYQNNGLPTHTSMWVGIWAAAMAGITAFQCASSLLFNLIIRKRTKFLAVYSSIVAVGAFGSFVGNCIAKDGPGIAFSVLWTVVAFVMCSRIFFLKHRASISAQATTETEMEESKYKSEDNKKHGRCRRCSSCCVAWICPVFMLVFGTFYAIEALTNGGFIVQFPAPGQLVKMTYAAPAGSSYNMHIYCKGERQDKPLIVLEAGGGSGAVSFMPLMDSLSSEFRMCAYDRAGTYGWSEAGPLPDLDIDNVNRLDILLEKVGEQPPYIMAGHSIGGQLVRLYHETFPNKTAGIVQFDSVPQYTWWIRFYESINQTALSPVGQDEGQAMFADFVRAVFPILPLLRLITAFNDMPPKYQLTSNSLYNSKNWNSQYWDVRVELSAFKDGSANATDTYYLTPGSLGDLPTLVVYAPGDDPTDWYRELQSQQAAASNNSLLVECPPPCYHSLVWDQVDFVADCLRNFTNSKL